MSAEDIGDDQEVKGLAGERTDLAWSRSGVAVLVCLAAVVKRILPEFSTLDARVVLIAALLICGAAWAFALFWARTVASSTLTGRRIADPRTLRAVAAGTAALGVAATVIAFLPQRQAELRRRGAVGVNVQDMGSKGKKPRKPQHSQHLPKVGSSTENKRLLHEEQQAVLSQMGAGGASSGMKVAVTAVIALIVVGAILSLLILTLR